MMKISEFASIYKVSERHVRRLISKYESDMVGHYEQRGNEGTFLDEAGVEFLKGKLQKSFDLVQAEETSEEIKLLNERLIFFMAKSTSLAEELVAAERRINENAAAVALLEAAKENVEKLESRTSEAEERARTAENERRQALDTLETMRREAEEQRIEAERRAQTAEDVADLNAQEAARAKSEAEDLRAQLDAIASAGRWKRKRLIKKLRKAHKVKLKEAQK